MALARMRATPTERREIRQDNAVRTKVPNRSGVLAQGVSRSGSNTIPDRRKTKNAVPGATVHGVHSKEKASQLPAKHTAKSGFNAMSKFAKPAHKAVARMVGYALTLDTADGWSGLAFVLTARLAETERAALAYAALRALDQEQAELVAATVLGAAGDPLPAFLGGMSDARHWASWTSPRELDAYALAALEAMKPPRRRAFLRHAQGRMAA